MPTIPTLSAMAVPQISHEHPHSYNCQRTTSRPIDTNSNTEIQILCPPPHRTLFYATRRRTIPSRRRLNRNKRRCFSISMSCLDLPTADDNLQQQQQGQQQQYQRNNSPFLDSHDHAGVPGPRDPVTIRTVYGRNNYRWMMLGIQSEETGYC